MRQLADTKAPSWSGYFDCAEFALRTAILFQRLPIQIFWTFIKDLKSLISHIQCERVEFIVKLL